MQRIVETVATFFHGLTSPEAYLNYLGKRIATYLNIPGRHEMSVAESSLLAWVKLYRRDENTDNSTVSYYLKGSLLALLLDLDMRVRTNGQRSLENYRSPRRCVPLAFISNWA